MAQSVGLFICGSSFWKSRVRSTIFLLLLRLTSSTVTDPSFRFSHHLAYQLHGLRYISLGSQPSGDSNMFSFEFEIWAPGLSTTRTTVACGPFSPSSSFHCTPVPTSKRLNSAADKVFL